MATTSPGSIARADLFKIQLLNGSTIYANSSQFDITYGGNVYYSTKNGAWERGAITSEASFDLRTETMSLKVIAPSTLSYPNAPGTTYNAAALLGLFDAAPVTVLTLYWNAGAIPPVNATNYIETKFYGFILPNGEITRSHIEFEVSDALYILNMKMPRNLIQASCWHTLGDVNCTIPLTTNSAYYENNSVGASSTRQNIILGTATSRTSPFYAQGYILMTSGQNNGRRFSVKTQTSTTSVLLARAMPLPLAVGDTFTMYAGCDKSPATCNGKFANLIHIGATPFCPNPEVAI